MRALERLIERCYERDRENQILQPVFAHIGADHPDHVAAFFAKLLSDPSL
jgi:hemoglobin